ncbi:GNAT family N-acetyltransferase [Endozoicomonas arenosclerae]|uniref:GNAT family N-acetyltransferase n=1 Tax=Endozoicomonas arenosclerae TaxID=1633495 RepID=UPI000783D49D|nr:GNAT family N-acetyltransferase [Endozoicomonas arenosclerae]
MQFIHEIDVDKKTHHQIKELRNSSFPDHTSEHSFFKQLPHIRCLEYRDSILVGYMGLDYRVMGVGDHHFKILGVIDFCVAESERGKGLGSSMLDSLASFAEVKDVDFIILVSENRSFYKRNGFRPLTVPSSWLRLHEYKNYGVAFEYIDDLWVKPVSDKHWPEGHVDWLGYMF